MLPISTVEATFLIVQKSRSVLDTAMSLTFVRAVLCKCLLLLLVDEFLFLPNSVSFKQAATEIDI